MTYDFSKFKKKAGETEDWFKLEISRLRTGRASPALIEDIKVDYYGAKTPLKGIAAISIEDARTLRVKPWDAEALLAIEQAIKSSELGIQAITEKDVVRVIFPLLTEERRNSLMKVVREKLEEARIVLRRERDEVWRDIQDKERKGEISEDDKFRGKDELQKLIDGSTDKLDEVTKKKEQEIKG